MGKLVIHLLIMTTEDIFQKLVFILQNNTSIRGNILPDTALLAESRIDSMDFMNYLTVIEETFAITVDEDDVLNRKLGVVKNMVGYIAERVR